MRALAVAAALLAAQAAWADIVGPATVIDGDSLVIDGQELRLHGADAFEQDQARGRPCGAGRGIGVSPGPLLYGGTGGLERDR